MKPIATLLVVLSLLSTLLLGGCNGGGGSNGSVQADAAPTPKPMTPKSVAAAAKHYQLEEPDGPRH